MFSQLTIFFLFPIGKREGIDDKKKPIPSMYVCVCNNPNVMCVTPKGEKWKQNLGIQEHKFMESVFVSEGTLFMFMFYGFSRRDQPLLFGFIRSIQF